MVYFLTFFDITASNTEPGLASLNISPNGGDNGPFLTMVLTTTSQLIWKVSWVSVRQASVHLLHYQELGDVCQ